MEPEAALLAINTLKKELSNTNQLARANALRTMSSIRVRIISQLVGLAVKKAATDSSPYVRKTAACAIPKLVRYVVGVVWVFGSQGRGNMSH
jgi:vesicle coat complex subunit